MKQKILQHFGNNFEPFYREYFPDSKPLKGDEHAALCCFHEDKNPSLNWNSRTGLFHCHACGTSGDIFKAFQMLKGGDFKQSLEGIANKFNIPLNGSTPKSKPGLGRIVKTYDYLDEKGNLIFQVVRYEPKDFRQRRPDGKGGWIYNLQGITPFPYRLPEIMHEKDVCVVESEKSTDGCIKLGIPTTNSPMGAGKWRAEYSEFLRGKNVAIFPDNDEPGRKHAQMVAQSLYGIASSIKIVELPGLNAKEDIYDFIQNAGHEAADQIRQLIDAAPLWEPAPAAEQDQSQEVKAEWADAILYAQDFHKLKISPRLVYLSPWLKEDSIIFINGWRGSGKTWFVLSILRAVANGGSFGPWKCNNPKPSLFVDGEMTISDDQERLTFLDLQNGTKEPLLIYADSYANSKGLPRASLLNPDWRDYMKSYMLANGVKLWVLDNIASLTPGVDENSKQEWDPINQFLLDLRFNGISSILLHHTGKNGDQRGTSAREDNADISIRLDRPQRYTPENGAHFICNFVKARISNRDLSLIADTEFQLIQNERGAYEWLFGNVNKNANEEIIRLFAEGVPQKEIHTLVGVSKGQVSKVLAREKKRY